MKKEKMLSESQTPQSFLVALPSAVLSGCLVFLSFPCFNLFPLQWISLVPLLWAIRHRQFWGGFLLGFFAGLATNIGGFYWIVGLLQEFGHMSYIPALSLMILLASYQALTFALSCGFSCYAVQKLHLSYLVVFPVLFTAIEYLVPFIFPWYFANGQQPFYAVTQIVEITGVSGLSFIIILFNCGISEIIHARIEKKGFSWSLVIAPLVFIGNIVYGVIRIEDVDEQITNAKKFKVGVVEANVGIWEKEAKRPDGSFLPPQEQIKILYGNLLKHQALSAKLEKEEKVDLLVWPESSYMPYTEVYSKTTEDDVIGISRGGRVIIVRGDNVIDSPSAGASLQVTGVNSVASGHESFVIAVGPKGAIYRFNGKEWIREQGHTDRDLFGVAVTRDGYGIAVGAQGTLLIRRDERWEIIESETTNDLRAAQYMAGNGGFIVVGDKGVARIWKNGLRHMSFGVERDLTSVFAGKDEIWAVGEGGLVIRARKGQTKILDVPTKVTLRGVWGSDPAFVVGDGGVILRCDDVCKRLSSPTKNDLYAITFDQGLRYIIGGKDGTLLSMKDDAISIIGNKGGIDIVSLAFLGFQEGYPLWHDVKRLYVSHVPLPRIDVFRPEKAVEEDSKTPLEDRNAAIRGFATPLLLGVITKTERKNFNGEYDYYNTALLVMPDGKVVGRYDKNYPLIFGEYLPFEDVFPFLRRWFPEAGNFNRGTEVEVFRLGDIRIGVMICYEDIIPSFTRLLVGKDPNVLINITNDAWFGKTSEPYLHLALATFRAIENRLFLIRSTNTGVSAVIDPVGRIRAETDLDNPETLTYQVGLLYGDTIYRKMGDIFAWVCCVVGLGIIGIASLRQKRGEQKAKKTVKKKHA